MGEIHVQTKKHSAVSSMWIWIVLALIIAAAVIYYLVTRNKAAGNAGPANTTGSLYSPVENSLVAATQNTVVYGS